jgi:hypothetical protein
MTYQPLNPDWARSPYTGLTWTHWVEVGRLLLSGVFRHLPHADAALRLPRHETAVTYPQPGDPAWRGRSEVFEGVARTLLIAAPLLAHFPELELHGIQLADYYRRAIRRLADPASAEFVGDIAAIVRESGDRPYQMTCECASLVIALRTAPAVLWHPLSPDDRDRLARVLSDWAHRRTHPHNWRLFNILILAFLRDHGYPINEELYADHLRVIRSFDAGDGWYRDGTLFDYYSVWAFQFYAPLWAHSTGYQTMPALAAAFEASTHQLLRTYDRIFDRDGRQIMWGRSNIYRFAASAPFGAAFLLREPGIRPGVARRVMSGNLMQFVGHPGFWHNGLPSLGFYGPFPPLIQPYSCAASPFWFGNAYHAVALGPDHPLWTATEERGSWAGVGADQACETELAGPGIVVTQYGPSGASELRTGKVLISAKSSMLPNYARLAFHSQFPWQADTPEGQPAMQYRFRCGADTWRPNLTLYAGYRDQVLYRRLAFNFEGGFGDHPLIDLADFAIANGLVRCDRVRICQANATLALGHYALPVVDGNCDVEHRTLPSGVQALTARSGNRQLALVAVRGWQQLDAVRASGLHPETEESILLQASSEHTQLYGGEALRITLLLHRIGGAPWTDDDLWPFTGLDIEPIAANGSSPTVRFTLANQQIRIVEYRMTEGALLL